MSTYSDYRKNMVQRFWKYQDTNFPDWEEYNVCIRDTELKAVPGRYVNYADGLKGNNHGQ